MSVSRRHFLGASAVAAVVAGTTARGKVFGANNRIRMGCIGLNGRGTEHINQFGKADGCEIAALCDVDSRVLQSRARLVERQSDKKPKTYTDVRDLLADDSIDAVSIATPNHWHSLIAIWACQAGKDVYVEKPLSHNVWEGRQLVKAVEKYGTILQHGTQGRSQSTWLRDIALLHDGFIGPMHLAKGFTYKTGNRRSIGHAVPENAPKYLDWERWQGPAQRQPYCSNYVHYNWHWFWPYGNGEVGNQGVHQMDQAVWGLNKGLPVKVFSTGGRYVWDDQADTPNTQITAFIYEDGTMLEFEVRNLGSYEEAGKTTGNHYLCADGYYVEGKGFFDMKHRHIEVKTEKPKSDGPWVNFLNAVRAKDPKLVHGTALEGHVASTHCHLANIAFRLGRSLEFDPAKERFVNDSEADALLTRSYEPGFEVPEIA